MRKMGVKHPQVNTAGVPWVRTKSPVKGGQEAYPPSLDLRRRKGNYCEAAPRFPAERLTHYILIIPPNSSLKRKEVSEQTLSNERGEIQSPNATVHEILMQGAYCQSYINLSFYRFSANIYIFFLNSDEYVWSTLTSFNSTTRRITFALSTLHFELF